MYNSKLFPKTEEKRREKISKYNSRLYKDRLYRNRGWLYGQYVVQRKYLKTIAKEANTVDSTILRWVNNFEFPKITLSERHKDPRLWKKFNETGRQKENRPRGENHWRYKKVSSRTYKQFYNSIEYDLWKKAVHERDGYICRGCGRKSKYLDAHHILPVRDFPHLVYAINNGITLCHSCHSKTISKEYKFVALFEKVVNSGKPLQTSEVIPSQAENNNSQACVETRDDPRK